MKKMEGTKRSRQRDAILAVLQGTTGHPTANWVYDEVRKEIPNISLGTVYRNLSKLADAGVILRLSVGDDTHHFDANFNPHYHLYCKKCAHVLDLDLPYESKLNEMAEAVQGAQIEWHNLIFYGICNQCCQNKIVKE